MKRSALWVAALHGMALMAHGLGGCTEVGTTNPPPREQEAKVLVCAPGSFMNGNECLPVKLDCPAETVQKDGECVGLASTPAIPEPQPQVAVADTGTDLPVEVDSRAVRTRPRARPLLISEIQSLESLFASMTKTAPDRPRLMRRLAEGYVELEAASARDAAAARDENERSKGTKIEQAARLAAIKYYSQLSQQYPLFCTSGATGGSGAGTGCTDEVLYYHALERIRANELDVARKTLLTLVQNWPQSALIGQAYFVFGEMFRKEARTDPSKWVIAEQAYAEAAKYPASPIASLALSRRAEARGKRGPSTAESNDP